MKEGRKVKPLWFFFSKTKVGEMRGGHTFRERGTASKIVLIVRVLVVPIVFVARLTDVYMYISDVGICNDGGGCGGEGEGDSDC